jgi:hypothetical protein
LPLSGRAGIPVLGQEMGFSFREMLCEVFDLCAPYGSRFHPLPGTTYSIAGYTFSPLSGESGILAL